MWQSWGTPTMGLSLLTNAMRVKVIRGFVGEDGEDLHPGNIVDLKEGFAAAMIFAKKVIPFTEPEPAPEPEPEPKPPAKKKRGRPRKKVVADGDSDG